MTLFYGSDLSPDPGQIILDPQCCPPPSSSILADTHWGANCEVWSRSFFPVCSLSVIILLSFLISRRNLYLYRLPFLLVFLFLGADPEPKQSIPDPQHCPIPQYSPCIKLTHTEGEKCKVSTSIFWFVLYLCPVIILDFFLMSRRNLYLYRLSFCTWPCFFVFWVGSGTETIHSGSTILQPLLQYSSWHTLRGSLWSLLVSDHFPICLKEKKKERSFIFSTTTTLMYTYNTLFEIINTIRQWFTKKTRCIGMI